MPYTELTTEQFTKMQALASEIITVHIQTKRHEKSECYNLEIKRGLVEKLLQLVESGSFIEIPVDGFNLYIAGTEITSISVPVPKTTPVEEKTVTE